MARRTRGSSASKILLVSARFWALPPPAGVQKTCFCRRGVRVRDTTSRKPSRLLIFGRKPSSSARPSSLEYLPVPPMPPRAVSVRLVRSWAEAGGLTSRFILRLDLSDGYGLMNARELNRVLKERGMTGRALARLLGVGEISVSRWRHGARRMHRAYARLLTLYLEGRIREEGADKSRRGGKRHGRVSR